LIKRDLHLIWFLLICFGLVYWGVFG